jgi:hypothetical protein
LRIQITLTEVPSMAFHPSIAVTSRSKMASKKVATRSVSTFLFLISQGVVAATIVTFFFGTGLWLLTPSWEEMRATRLDANAATADRPAPADPIAATADRPAPADPIAATADRPAPADPIAATADQPMPADPIAATADRPAPADPIAATADQPIPLTTIPEDSLVPSLKEVEPRLIVSTLVDLTALLAASARPAATPSNWHETPARNVLRGQRYDHLLRMDANFRRYRMNKECGPISDPWLRLNCLLSFGLTSR